MSWDSFQREILAELGHVVYRQAGVAIAEAAEAPRAETTQLDTTVLDDQMLARVARAAHMTTQALQARIGDMGVIACLQGNAAAKRALWPRLRALRKQHG